MEFTGKEISLTEKKKKVQKVNSGLSEQEGESKA